MTLWTALGRDAAGAWIRDVLAGELSDLEVTEFDLPSDRSTIVVDAGGENFIVSGVACAQAFDPIATDGDRRKTSQPATSLSCRETSAEATATAACGQRAKRARKTVLNASPISEMFRLDLRLADILIVNRSEARTLGAQSDDRHRCSKVALQPEELRDSRDHARSPRAVLWLSAGGQTIRFACRLHKSRPSTPAVPAMCFAARLPAALANGLDVGKQR